MYSASFINLSNAMENKNDEKYAFYEEITEVENLLNAKDTEINGLKATITELYEQNGNLLKDKLILLDSYEEKIKEKNNIIKSYATELNQLSIRMTKIEEEDEKIQEIQQLSSQCEVFKNKATIEAKKAVLAKEKLSLVLKVHELEMQSQSLDIEWLQEAYNRSKGEIATLKSFQKNSEVVKEHAKDCHDNLDLLKRQYELKMSQMIDEQIRMESELSRSQERVRELQNLLGKQERSTHQSYEDEARQFREHSRNTQQSFSDCQENADQQKEIEVLKILIQQRDCTIERLLETKISQSSTKY